MSSDICPFCYHSIDRRRLWYACRGSPAAGHRRCAVAVNENRLDETGHEEEMFPVFPPPARWVPGVFRRFLPRRAACPHCRGETGRQVCPCCNTPLPSEFRDSFSPVIAMAGARSTGKTVYLTVLASQIQGPIRRRFAADVHLHGDAGNRWLALNKKLIFKTGKLPPITEQPNGRSEPLLFEWRRERLRIRRRYRSSYLSFLDTAGESLGTDRGIDELKFLAKVNAFIILLDPFAIPGLPERIGLPKVAQSPTEALKVVQQVTRVLREETAVKGMITIPVAVVFAKVDALRDHPDILDKAIFAAESDLGHYDARTGRSLHDYVRSMLHDLGADDIDQTFAANYTKYQYFAVSALGHPPDYQQSTVSPELVHPVRVSEPLVWLLAHYRLVPRGRDDG